MDLDLKAKTLENNIVLLELKGYLDAHTFEKLDRAIDQLFAKGHYKLIVDLSQVGYISSAGAGVFIGAIGKAKDNEGDIVLLKPSRGVKEVFDLLGLTQIFQIKNSPDEAKKAFDSGAA